MAPFLRLRSRLLRASPARACPLTPLTGLHKEERMAGAPQEKPTMKPTLGLTGVTVNAMALIAPGAFLWITYQLQASQALPGSGETTGLDILPGILFALGLAFLTALAYSELARIYPEAGTGSCYYFAERSFLDKANAAHHRWA